MSVYGTNCCQLPGTDGVVSTHKATGLPLVSVCLTVWYTCAVMFGSQWAPSGSLATHNGTNRQNTL